MFTFSRGVLLLAFLTVLPPTYANEEPAMLTSEHPIQPPVAAKHPRTLKKTRGYPHRQLLLAA